MKDNFKVFKPAGKMQFEFTDLIAGYVSDFNESEKTFSLTTSDKRKFSVALGDTTFARLLRNLDEPYQDATGNMYSLLKQDGPKVSVTSLSGRSSPMAISTTKSIVRPFPSVVRLRRIRSARRPTPSAV